MWDASVADGIKAHLTPSPESAQPISIWVCLYCRRRPLSAAVAATAGACPCDGEGADRNSGLQVDLPRRVVACLPARGAHLRALHLLPRPLAPASPVLMVTHFLAPPSWHKLGMSFPPLGACRACRAPRLKQRDEEQAGCFAGGTQRSCVCVFSCFVLAVQECVMCMHVYIVYFTDACIGADKKINRMNVPVYFEAIFELFLQNFLNKHCLNPEDSNV